MRAHNDAQRVFCRVDGLCWTQEEPANHRCSGSLMLRWLPTTLDLGLFWIGLSWVYILDIDFVKGKTKTLINK